MSSLLLTYANIHLCRYNHTVISGVTNKLTDTGKKVCRVCRIATDERCGHSGTDGAAPGGSGRSSADVSNAAELRRRSSRRLAAGLHRRADGQRSRSANPQR